MSKAQENQLGKYKFKITQSPNDITFGISTLEESEGLNINVKWDKEGRKLALNCEGKEKEENFDVGVTLDKIKRQLSIDYKSKDSDGRTTGSGNMSMLLPPGNLFALEGGGTFPIEPKYEKSLEETPLAPIPLIKEHSISPYEKIDPHMLKKLFFNTAKYVPKLREVIQSDGIITESDLNKVFVTANERRGVKQVLTRLSKTEKIKPKPVEKIGKDYKILYPSIFSQILTAVGLEEVSSEKVTSYV